MRFEYFSPTDESRSCVARTMTKLTGKDYDTVKAELTALAQSMGLDSYNDEAVFVRYMEEHGITKHKGYSGTRAGELLLGTGTYCFFCTDGKEFFHLMPVIDDVLYDRKDVYRELYVIAVYRKESSE